LEALKKIPQSPGRKAQHMAIEGAALFLRAYALYNLAQIFIPPYDSSTANTDLGLPLRLKPDVTETSVRSSVQQTYDQLLEDLKESIKLLPALMDSERPNRPSKPAAFAMLARAYLSMRAYKLAGDFADSALGIKSSLINYNDIDRLAPFPFNSKNPEILYQAKVSSTTALLAWAAKETYIDSTLIRSYNANDLRRSLFYTFNSTGQATLKSNYTGDIHLFTGIAVDEMYLIKAEAMARAGNQEQAINALNTLLEKRWLKDTYTYLKPAPGLDLLGMVLTERKKELAFRGLRWTDIRRLNKEGFAITLKRILHGQLVQLPPNDPKYVLPIPPDVIALSGMPQNPR
jgi:hypothetical protein